jgi:hypothetical protein
MPDLEYRLRHEGGLWHWEVLTERGLLLGHGATFTRAGAAGEAMAYGSHPARLAEIDAAETARRREIAHHALAEAERRWQVANQRVSELAWLHDRSRALLSTARMAVAEARSLLAITQV